MLTWVWNSALWPWANSGSFPRLIFLSCKLKFNNCFCLTGLWLRLNELIHVISWFILSAWQMSATIIISYYSCLPIIPLGISTSFLVPRFRLGGKKLETLFSIWIQSPLSCSCIFPSHVHFHHLRKTDDYSGRARKWVSGLEETVDCIVPIPLVTQEKDNVAFIANPDDNGILTSFLENGIPELDF